MTNELAFVLINPYTIAKSRTGGVLGRFMSRTGLDLVGARMFAPSARLVEEYAGLISSSRNLAPEIRSLLADYVRKNYAPDHKTGRPRRVMMILLEGENAVQKVINTAGPVIIGSGETIRDTFGDYVVDDDKKVKYFEPAVLIGSGHEDAAATLKLWNRYNFTDGGLLKAAVDVNAGSGQWQRTLVLIKPDNFMFPSSRPGNIIDMLSRSGLRIIAAKVHQMSVLQAEEFYRPVRPVLREKMKSRVGEKTVKMLEQEFHIEVSPDIRKMIEDNIGPLVGDEQFNQIIKFMTGCYPPACTREEKARDGRSRCLALVYAGPDAVEKIRRLLGPTDPSKAQPGSVRREFGHDIMVNAAHASDSVENAEREIAIVKIEEDLFSPLVKKYYGE
ncbi:MAG: nucleoside-diphosphate kinase [Kiritimatiellae bacterium]|nr:nucleoside-diphosphate kinase [Kiritimatiellia bacterium]